ncbi:pyrroline-5-carboxylate reductase [Liquorilactobacillus vini]|uniref:pyrroline-5-carboxylate reductase n=1 Tax=Liquorilactobacillus vini TaxID=238015 RepID=UPI000310E5C3|nr:pyrroline-5-carboxylate reductase [Liquorilactobacillus vini]
MKIGFIGVGNMAKAIIQGWLKADAVSPNEIVIHSAHPSNYEKYAAKYGLQSAKNNIEVVQQADLLCLAVKPQTLTKVLQEIRTTVVQQHSIIISMVTGFSLKQLEQSLQNHDLKILRIMPNVNVEINAGMTALAGNRNLSATDFELCQNLIGKLGQTMEIAEKDFSLFVALAGSSPAFIYLFIDAMSRAGVKYGFNKQQATKIAAQAVLGSAQKVLASDEQTPWDLIDAVSSPGGTTIAGLLAMEEAGFMTSVIKGIDATIAKDQGKD